MPIPRAIERADAARRKRLSRARRAEAGIVEVTLAVPAELAEVVKGWCRAAVEARPARLAGPASTEAAEAGSAPRPTSCAEAEAGSLATPWRAVERQVAPVGGMLHAARQGAPTATLQRGETLAARYRRMTGQPVPDLPHLAWMHECLA